MGLDGGMKTNRTDMVKPISDSVRNNEKKVKKGVSSKSYWTESKENGSDLTSNIMCSKRGDFVNSSDIDHNNPQNKKKYVSIDLLGANGILEYVCPLSQSTPSPSSPKKFVCLFGCGHIFEYETFNIVLERNERVCPICGKPILGSDLVILTPEPSEKGTIKKPKKDTSIPPAPSIQVLA